MAARPALSRPGVDWRTGPIRDPRIAPGQLPTSWADARFEPPRGDVCTGCQGARFWALPGARGWCCATCHPPTDPSGVRGVSTAREP